MHHNSDTSTHPRRRNPLVVGAVTSSYRLPNYYLQTNATSESTSLNRLLLGLDSFQPDFAFLLGACFADPNHAASHRVERVFIQDDFDYLSAPQLESSAHPEPIVRGIKHKARLSFKFEDQAGTPFARASLRVATFGNRHRLPSQLAGGQYVTCEALLTLLVFIAHRRAQTQEVKWRNIRRKLILLRSVACP